MSTNARIAIKTKEGDYKSIYLHWDGYPDGAGKTLEKHYNTYEKAEKLINGGDLSSLEASSDCPDGHSFDTPKSGYCIYYGRDRGETNVDYKVSESELLLPREEFNYLFEDGKWRQM